MPFKIIKNIVPWVLTLTKCDTLAYYNNKTTINSVYSYNVNLRQ
jgi:hypothetical protein